MVTEAVRRSKAALTISPDTVVEARLKRLELRQAKSRKIKVKQIIDYADMLLLLLLLLLPYSLGLGLFPKMQTYLSSHQASPKGAFGELAILLPSSYQASRAGGWRPLAALPMPAATLAAKKKKVPHGSCRCCCVLHLFITL